MILTNAELDEIFELIANATTSASNVEWHYWYRAESYLTFEALGIEREQIHAVLALMNSADVAKVELQHGDARSLVLVCYPWLLPALQIDTFAYVKFALKFDKHNLLQQINILSFKKSTVEPNFIVFGQEWHSYYEWNAWTWLSARPELILKMDHLNWTPRLVQTVLGQRPQLVDQLGVKHVNEEVVQAACESNPLNIFYFPQLYWDESRLRAAIAIDPYVIFELPSKKFTRELVLAASGRDPHVLLNVPVEFWNKSIVETIIEINPGMIVAVPEALLSKKLVASALSSEATLLFELAESFWNEKRLETAIQSDPSLILQVGEKWLTIELMLTSVKSGYPQAVRCYFGTWECELVDRVIAASSEVIAYLPKGVISAQRYVEIVMTHPKLFPTVPVNDVTPALVQAVVHQVPGMLAHVPKQFKTTALCSYAVTCDPNLIQYVPRHIKMRVLELQATHR